MRRAKRGDTPTCRKCGGGMNYLRTETIMREVKQKKGKPWEHAQTAILEPRTYDFYECAECGLRYMLRDKSNEPM